MKEFKRSLKAIYDSSTKDSNWIYSCYDKYLNDDARKMYSKEYLQAYEDKQKAELDEVRKNTSIQISKALEEYKATLSPNEELINSEAYQMRLANTLQLMQMQKIGVDTEINTSILDFIAEAKDTQTLKLIQNAYNNAYINNYCREHDPQVDMVAAQQLAEGCREALKGGDSYSARLAIYNIENITE